MLKIKKNIPLAPLTTFKIGGPAKFLAVIKNEKDFWEAIRTAQKNNWEIFVLGGGSNILVNDKGFEGLVIQIDNSFCQQKETILTCGAGKQLSEILSETSLNGFSGLEWSAGIPKATLGGAIRGNAGAFGTSMADLVKSVKAFDIKNHRLKKFSASECQFGYRESLFKNNRHLIVFSAELKLRKEKKDLIRKKIKKVLERRKKSQPPYPSGGSFFTNPSVDNQGLIKEFEKENHVSLRGNKIPAGWLIEKAGLKGKTIGGAQVSPQHANFIINTGTATAEDVIMLSSLIKQRVRTSFGLQLKEEVQLVGF